MTGSTSQIHQTSISKQQETVSVGENVFIHLWFDVCTLDTIIFFQFIHLNFVVEMSDVANNSSILHFFHVFYTNNVTIAGSGHIYIAFGQGIFHGTYFKSFHSCLKCTNGVNFGHQHPRTISPHGFGTTFTHIAISAHNHHFSCQHNIGSAFNAIGQRFAAAIEVVKFRFGNRIIHIESREKQRSFFEHLIQAVYTRCGFFGYTLDVRRHSVPDSVVLFQNYFKDFI